MPWKQDRLTRLTCHISRWEFPGFHDKLTPNSPTSWMARNKRPEQ